MKDTLIAIQQREGLTDLEMATRLGIARPTWSMIRRDVLPLSDRVAMGAVRAFPELLGALVRSVTHTEPEGATR